MKSREEVQTGVESFELAIELLDDGGLALLPLIDKALRVVR